MNFTDPPTIVVKTPADIDSLVTLICETEDEDFTIFVQRRPIIAVYKNGNRVSTWVSFDNESDPWRMFNNCQLGVKEVRDLVVRTMNQFTNYTVW